jgi:hypothetical protein
MVEHELAPDATAERKLLKLFGSGSYRQRLT